MNVWSRWMIFLPQSLDWENHTSTFTQPTWESSSTPLLRLCLAETLCMCVCGGGVGGNVTPVTQVLNCTRFILKKCQCCVGKVGIPCFFTGKYVLKQKEINKMWDLMGTVGWNSNRLTKTFKCRKLFPHVQRIHRSAQSDSLRVWQIKGFSRCAINTGSHHLGGTCTAVKLCGNTTRLLSDKMSNYCRVFGCNNHPD